MRTVKFVVDSDPYKAGQIVKLEDQTATNVIANGWAHANDAHVFGAPEPEAVEPPAPAPPPAPAAPAGSPATRAAAAAKAMGTARGGSSSTAANNGE